MSKYHSKKVNIEGQVFDSVKEARRYRELKLMEYAGRISHLQRQVKYVLIPAQREADSVGPRGGIKKGRLIEREVSYMADFVYFDDLGHIVVEDVKGYKKGQAYALFTVKRKLMLERYNICVQEV